jgi:phosphoglycerate dehydrogenase-like enzyme
MNSAMQLSAIGIGINWAILPLSSLISGADGCITNWGTCAISADILNMAPNLQIIAHVAGSVKPIITDAVWERGITVTSAAPSIAVGVAEHTLGLILSAMKRCYWFNNIIHAGGWKDETEISKVVELFGLKIGIAGGGHVGRNLIRLLKNFDVDIYLYDPFTSIESCAELGVKKADSMEDLMSIIDVLSLNAPELPETKHMVNKRNLKLLKDGAYHREHRQGIVN